MLCKILEKSSTSLLKSSVLYVQIYTCRKQVQLGYHCSCMPIPSQELVKLPAISVACPSYSDVLLQTKILHLMANSGEGGGGEGRGGDEGEGMKGRGGGEGRGGGGGEGRGGEQDGGRKVTMG